MLGVSIFITAVICTSTGLLIGAACALRAHHDLLDSNRRLADQVCALHTRIQRIRFIPNNGKKPNGGLLKAQRIAGGEI